MKKILFLCLTVFAITAVQAQITFGVKAGANMSTFAGDDSEDAEMLFGFNVGGKVNIPFGTTWAVQPEIIYSAQGAKFDEGKLAQSYIRIPVMFQYANPGGFYAETGPNIGFLMTAEAKVDGLGDEDVKDMFKGTDFAWAIGLGYRMKNGIGIGARYNMGLSSITEDDAGDIKTSVINVGLFYNFGGQK